MRQFNLVNREFHPSIDRAPKAAPYRRSTLCSHGDSPLLSLPFILSLVGIPISLLLIFDTSLPPFHSLPPSIPFFLGQHWLSFNTSYLDYCTAIQLPLPPPIHEFHHLVDLLRFTPSPNMN
ncbi:hypothetical protein PG993_011368 [Apiospora rasikravindrae]|uniref:Uncharacterized protein n=1 Tax=Apiospora rasikravindrae TaxID=990691 RepID=A0ABR1SE10_9PEZI